MELKHDEHGIDFGSRRLCTAGDCPQTEEPFGFVAGKTPVFDGTPSHSTANSGLVAQS
jgi:hypothetical protein